MKPVKVEFQAFGPYVGYEMVDFEAIASKGLFLICGKTGIGKTMILDAITFALFGKSSGHGRDDFEAMRCTNAEFDKTTFVKFEFENNGEYYIFERRLERKRTKLSASYNVARKDDDGVWRPLLENAKEKALNSKAVEIIGLEYEQFRQVIVLPQGQFEKLLTSNSDEKESILTSIFGEEMWQRIAEIFYSNAEERRNELKGVQARIQNSLSEEQCETISQLELLVTNKREQGKKLDEEYKKADHESIIKEQQKLLTLAKRFGDMHKVEEKLSELESNKDQRTSWEVRVNDAKRAERVRKYIEAVDIASVALNKRKNNEISVNKKAEEKREAAKKASDDLRNHLSKEIEAEELKKKKIYYESKRGDYKGLDAAEKELKEKKRIAKKATDEEIEARNKSSAVSGVIVELQNEYNDLQSEHSELLNGYLAGITGELASQLKKGEPCPVCGSTQHPKKARVSDNSITKAMVDAKKKAAEIKYKELQTKLAEQEAANKLVDEKHAVVEALNNEVVMLAANLDIRKKNLVDGISTAGKLEAEIAKLNESITEFENIKVQLTDADKAAARVYTEAQAQIAAAEEETKAANEAYSKADAELKDALADNMFETKDEARKLMMHPEELEELQALIASFDANIKAVKENLKNIKAELKDKDEPDEEKCLELIELSDAAKAEYIEKKAVLKKEIERLQNKVDTLREEGKGIEGKIREADEDYAFARKLRGDSGTGLQRYVLGIMFSSVVTAANKMLEMVHGGRYRLYRSDDKAQGTNKRGLELKVFDKHSEDHDGRFVSTLSGGEKFLASLALSIGMSMVAQKSGIKINALFIDEGFGSLDEESIGDAMNVLNSIQEANGLVGIISHVQLLQDQIPSKLRVVQDEKGSHIVQTIG